jgi:hypothetical protein
VPFDQNIFLTHKLIKGEEAFMPDFQQYSNLEDSVLIIATETEYFANHVVFAE